MYIVSVTNKALPMPSIQESPYVTIKLYDESPQKQFSAQATLNVDGFGTGGQENFAPSYPNFASQIDNKCIPWCAEV